MAFLASVTDKGGFQQDRASVFPSDKLIAVFFSMVFDLVRYRGWVFADPPGYGLEGCTVVEAGLNLFSLFDGQMLVLSALLGFHSLRSLFWDISQFKFNHISCLTVNPIPKSHCGTYSGNLLTKKPYKKNSVILKKLLTNSLVLHIITFVGCDEHR